MESLFPLLGIIGLIAYFVNRRANKEMDDNWEAHEAAINQQYDDVINSMYESAQKTADETNKHITDAINQSQEPDTLGLMFSTLSNLGCQPIRNDDGTLSVSYQGENFHIEFGGMYARVWDPMWSGIKADDPELPKVREAMNSANFNFGPTVVMTAPNEDGVIGFHSRRDIMLHPACPDNVPFVKAVLDSFFEIKEQMRNSYQQLTIQQIEKRKNRRPVGFTTNHEPESDKE